MNLPGSRLAQVLCFAAVYFVAARVGLLFAVVHPSVSPVWPPTGVALAGLLLLGRTAWPGIAVGAALANLAAGTGGPASACIALGNTGEALLALLLLERARFDRHFQHPRDVVALLGAAVLAPVLSATVGIASLTVAGVAASSPLATLWWLWWSSDALGMLAFAPPLVTLATRPWRSAGPARWAEGAALAAAVALVGVLFFGGVVRHGASPLSLAYTVFPLVVWAALRFGPAGAAVVNMAVFGLAVWATLLGEGPFQRDTVGEGVVYAQVFVAVETVTALLLAAAMAWREQTANSLRVSREQMAEIQHVAQLGGWEWDPATGRVWWSDEFYDILGHPRQSTASYEGFLERVHPEDRARVAAAVHEAGRRGEGFELEHRVVRPDGTERIVVGRGRAMLAAPGRLLRMVGTTQDVTEQRLAEGQRSALALAAAGRVEAEEANRLKDEFLATLSHELRTPLNAIVGWSNLMLAGGMDTTAQERALRTIVRSSTVLTQLIGDVLDVSRIAAGKVHLAQQPLMLVAVAETAVDAARPAAAAKGIRLSIADGRALAAELVSGDAPRLQQVIGNLLSNAIKFTPAGGRVDVDVTRNDGDLTVSVSDTGVGIPAAFLPHVFDRFRQADSSTTRAFGGLGIGLAIARNLVELHGGRLEVQSDGEDRGAHFAVHLPRIETERLVVPPRPADSGHAWAAVPRLDGVRVLAVEDDEDSRGVLEAVLVRLGAEVTLAANAADGLALLQELRPDVLLSDLEMPGEDGYALMRRVRALPPERGGRTPAAAVSAHVGSDERVRSREAGFELHVGKPVKPSEVAMAVAALAARGRKPGE